MGGGRHVTTVSSKSDYSFVQFTISPWQAQILQHGEAVSVWDLVGAVAPKPLTTHEVHVGTISVRATGKCDITTKHRRVGGIPVKYCHQLQRVDGSHYAAGARALSPLAEARSLCALDQ